MNLFRIVSFAGIAAALTAFAVPASAAPSLVGRWITYDDDTGRESSIIEIDTDGGGLAGKVIKVFPKPGEAADPLCKKCDGADKDHPVVGLTILKGFHQDGDAWDDGTILDPRSGDVYSCTLRLEDDGKKLRVRGFLGISLLGKTVTWTRATASD